MARNPDGTTDGKSSERSRRSGGGYFGPPAKQVGKVFGAAKQTIVNPGDRTVGPKITNKQTSTSLLDGGGGPGGGGGGGISAAEMSARSAGKAKSRVENENTQKIIDALLASLGGYEKGRDQQLANADNTLDQTLQGILNSLSLATQDYAESGSANEQDQAAKSAANVTNRARERVSLLQQAASQGAGETDQLRSQIQAFLNADANQQEVDRSFFDTERSINSQIAGANSQAETSRRSAWAQNQESKTSAWNEFWKNRGDVFTNIQRTAAQNSNVDSDYSEAFSARLGGYDPVKEAADAAGRTYEVQKQDDDWFRQGRQNLRNKKTASTSRAGATTIKAPKAAEGATLRGRQ
ncbi:hypothetical protein SEA_MAZUN_44 [Microbacterium phage Mazun]|nr:hypothetical protein SEA_MAZUN_44 [Microbacterium phage Mazun]